MSAKPLTTDDLWPTQSAKPKGRPATNTEMFRELDADLTMAYQLFRAGRSSQVIAGITNRGEVKARIRAEIIACNFQGRYLLDKHRRLTEETFAQAFERLYGEPL